ncbi:formate/nitrite transporter family protein [Neisseria sp.]|uniref:formate/nitrite transporter family protein n=1 Tax=Neisseria sp. TaxID=192066 RepID=UPI0026DCCBBF|nr:formate/nitrite transporter family protein [Neisseria sp.]MDO4908160.1 formate/nitrite transporter family protein [Neisseria sp.]
MGSLLPEQILQETVEKGAAKAQGSMQALSILGFLGGMYISLGYLAYIRVVGGMPHDWGSLAVFIGSAVFPIGLICILIGGGELITGNMMVLPVAWLAKRISLAQWGRNWLIVTLANLVGAFFVAWFFGHYVGLTEGAVLAKTVSAAEGKVAEDFGRALVSGIGCNWMVCMGVWLCYGARSFSGKVLGIWFPVMIFVLAGFQHVVANMFVIPAAIWAGADISWAQFGRNMVSVYIGNAIGGAVFVGALYFYAYRGKLQAGG